MIILKKLLFLLILSFVTFSAFASNNIISPNNKNINYIGRWDTSNPNEFHSYWGGAYFNTEFTGKEITLKLASEVNIFVFVDGKEMLFKKANGEVKIVAENTKPGRHSIMVVAKFQNDEIVLQGIILSKNGKLFPPKKSKHWIEFIGDSITSGDRTTKGNISAYPWLTGEALKTAHTQISYCGIPLTNGYHFDYNGAPEVGMEAAYLDLKEPNNNPDVQWNFDGRSPNLIIVNLGTNDASLKVDKTLFERTYRQFLRNIRFAHRAAFIMVLIPFNQSYHKEINEIVTQEGIRDSRLLKIETANWLNATDFVDGTHPTDAGHKKISAQLIKIIKPYLF